jgi:hypothetical protein
MQAAIAKSPAKERADGLGCLWNEYRIRKLDIAEISDALRYATWALERRNIRRDVTTNTDSEGDWGIIGLGNTRSQAIADALPDSGFMQSTCNDPDFLAEVAKLQAKRDHARKVQEAEEALASAKLARLEVKAAAEKAFKTALKRARIYDAACAGTADQAKVDSITARIRNESGMEAAQAAVESAQVALDSLH